MVAKLSGPDHMQAMPGITSQLQRGGNARLTNACLMSVLSVYLQNILIIRTQIGTHLVNCVQHNIMSYQVCLQHILCLVSIGTHPMGKTSPISYCKQLPVEVVVNPAVANNYSNPIITILPDSDLIQ